MNKKSPSCAELSAQEGLCQLKIVKKVEAVCVGIIIPDYLFEVNGSPAWILDARAPGEPIIKSAHVEQAYSYAIHPEVRAKYFALCNGKEFVLFSIDKIDPIFHFPTRAIPVYWDSLKEYLEPANIFRNSLLTLGRILDFTQKIGF